MADIASQGSILINASGVLKELVKIKEADIKDGGKTEVVTALGVSRGAGFRRSQGGFELDLVNYRQVGKTPEVDWQRLLRTQETFTVIFQDEGNGERVSYTSRVSKIDSKRNPEGVFEDTLNIVATQDFHT